MIVHEPLIAERYAQALLRTAKKRGNVAVVLDEVESMLPAMQGKSTLRVYLEAPQISTEAKEELIAKAFKGRVDKLIYDLMLLLMRKRRIEHFRPILERFRTLVELDQGIYEAEIATAKPLEDVEKQTLLRALETYTSAKLRINYLVKPELIAGVRFSYGDTLIDDTVRGKLSKLRQNLETAAKA